MDSVVQLYHLLGELTNKISRVVYDIQPSRRTESDDGSGFLATVCFVRRSLLGELTNETSRVVYDIQPSRRTESDGGSGS